MLSAFKKLTQTKDGIYLVIAGSGEKDYLQKIQKNVKELSLTNKVKFTGLVSQETKQLPFDSVILSTEEISSKLEASSDMVNIIQFLRILQKSQSNASARTLEVRNWAGNHTTTAPTMLTAY